MLFSPLSNRSRCFTRLAGSGLASVAAVLTLAPAAVAAPPPTTVAELAAGTPLVVEPFTGATADAGFTAFGSACLTGAPAGAPPGPGLHPLGSCSSTPVGPVPPAGGEGFGYLQLTDASNDQAGAVLYNQPIPATQGLQVSFEQWQYGSTTPATPADGISFFLTDGAGDITTPGAFGGSLGYAQKLPNDDPANPFLPGVDNGYLGIGLDVLGNYFGDWERRGNGCTQTSPAGDVFRVPAPGPNMVTVRGPGNGTEGYCFLTATTSNFTTTGPWPSTLPGQLQGTLTTMPPGTTPEQAEALLEPSKRTVTVTVSPAPGPQVTVSIDFNDGVGAQQVLSFPAPQPVPTTYKFGFAASTGLFTDVHLIRTVQVSSVQPLPASLNLVKQIDNDPPLPAVLGVGAQIPYQFVVTNTGAVPLTGLGINDPMFTQIACPTGINAGETVTCTATYIVTEADAARGYLLNTATAVATGPDGTVVSPPAQLITPLGSRIAMTLAKQADTHHVYEIGETVEYTYTVTNVTPSVIDDLRIVDDRVAQVICESTTLQPAGSPDASTICRGTYTITEADARQHCLTNIAVAIGNTGEVTSPPAYATVAVKHPKPY